MYIKAVILTLLVGISSAIFAMGTPSFEPNPFIGPYVGIGLGGTEATADFLTEANARYADFNQFNPNPPFLPRNRNVNLQEQGATLTDHHVLGAVFGGYGFAYGNLYLAGEIAGSFSEYTLSRPTNYYVNGSIFNDGVNLWNTTTLRMNTAEFDADLKTGYLFTPTSLFYIRVGLAVNDLKLRSHTAFTHTVGDFINFNGRVFAKTTSLNLTRDKSKVGLRLGAGFEQYIGKHISMALDYIYTYYGSIRVAGTGGDTRLLVPVPVGPPPRGFINGLSTTARIKNVNRQTFLVSIIYHMGSLFS